MGDVLPKFRYFRSIVFGILVGPPLFRNGLENEKSVVFWKKSWYSFSIIVVSDAPYTLVLRDEGEAGRRLIGGQGKEKNKKGNRRKILRIMCTF